MVGKWNLYIHIEHEHGEVDFGVCGHHVYICKYICPSLSSVTTNLILLNYTVTL